MMLANSNNNNNNNNNGNLGRSNSNQNANDYYVEMSRSMRAFIDSLPEKLTIGEEIKTYQFWKALRTEFIANFLLVVFSFGIQNIDVHHDVDHSSPSNTIIDQINQLKNALALGLIVASLVQCMGHISGCHLSWAITLGLFVSDRITSLRLTAYLIVQCLAASLAAVVVQCLFGRLMPITLASNLTSVQMFGFEFLATFFVVLVYLANCDVHRTDLGFKALSIGLAYSVGHLFTFTSTGASLSPSRALAAALITGTWCLHWIYWLSSFLAGLFGGLIYEYIGSIKPVVPSSSSSSTNKDCCCCCRHGGGSIGCCINCHLHQQTASSRLHRQLNGIKEISDFRTIDVSPSIVQQQQQISTSNHTTTSTAIINPISDSMIAVIGQQQQQTSLNHITNSSIDETEFSMAQTAIATINGKNQNQQLKNGSNHQKRF